MRRLIAMTISGLVLGPALAACGSHSPAASTTQADRSLPVDGTYGGIMQLSRGTVLNCGNANAITLHVKDHAFNYQLNQPQVDWRPVLTFSAQIAQDGSFNARSGPDFMRGRVANGTIQGEIAGDFCGFTFVANRGGTI